MDYISRAFRDTKSAAITLGVGTVVITHSAMVLGFLPGTWSESQKSNHATLNLAAAAAIVYGSGLLG
jgi:hypothetical protein